MEFLAFPEPTRAFGKFVAGFDGGEAQRGDFSWNFRELGVNGNEERKEGTFLWKKMAAQGPEELFHCGAAQFRNDLSKIYRAKSGLVRED